MREHLAVSSRSVGVMPYVNRLRAEDIRHSDEEILTYCTGFPSKLPMRTPSKTELGRPARSPVAHPSHIAKLAKRAKHGRDGTAYGRSRTSPKAFFVHHTQQLALAAILGDAKAIRRETTGITRGTLGPGHMHVPGAHAITVVLIID